MSEGRNIEIKIAATGGDQAAAEVRKVESAAESLGKTSPSSTGFGGMLDKLPAQAEAATVKTRDLNAEVDEMIRKMGEVSKETENAGETFKEAGEKAETLAGKVENTARPSTRGRMSEIAMATGAIGIAAAAAAQTFEEVADAIASVNTDQLRAVDSAMADQIEKAKEWAEALKNPVATLLKLTTGETVASAFAGMNEQLALNAKQHEEAIDRLIETGITQRDALKEMAAEIKAANAILDAKDTADGKARDRADKKEIRDGAAPEDVKARRAEDDAKKKIEKIDRDLDAKAPGVQSAYDNLQQGKSNLDQVSKQEKVTPEELGKAKKQVEDLQKEFDHLKQDYETAKQIAGENRRGVREETAGKVEELGADKSERLQKEKASEDAAAARKEAQKKQKAAEEAAQAARRAQQADLQTRQENLAGATTGNRAKIEGSSNQKKELQSLAKDIGKADTNAEIAAVREKINASQTALGSAVVGALTEMVNKQAQMVKEVEILRKQIRNVGR